MPVTPRQPLAVAAVVALGLAALAAAIGVTFAVLNARTSSGRAVAGSGSVAVSSPASLSCPVTTSPASDPVHIRPGDNGSCTFAYTYAGLPAWVAVDVAGTSTPAPGATPPPAPYGSSAAPAAVGLFGGATPLELRVGSASGAKLPVSGSGSVSNVLLSDPSSPTASGSGSVTVYWSLPASAGNGYQAAGGTLTLTVHAVQASNNPMLNGTPGTTGTLSCSQLTVCPAASGFSWS
jgi:hypothetical protein